MMIHDITAKVGSHKERRRVGRGKGSGLGKTSGRGHKGAGSRAGATGSIRASREGGQMPFFRRIPKRGFSNAAFETIYAVINIRALEARFNDGGEVNPDLLVKAGLISDTSRPVKVLGDGQISKKLNVSAAAFSKVAAQKIADAGGSVTVLK